MALTKAELVEIAKEMAAAEKAFLAVGTRQTESMSVEEKVDADIEYRMALGRQAKAARDYAAALDEHVASEIAKAEIVSISAIGTVDTI